MSTLSLLATAPPAPPTDISTLLPIEQFLLDLVIVLVLARLFGLAARWVGQPPVVGEIIAGIALGPTLFSGEIRNHLFYVENPVKDATGKPGPLIDLTGSWLTAIATIGLVLFMFIVGYEVDRTLFKGRERVAATVSLGSIILPMIGGTLLGLWLVDRHPDIGVDKLPAALFLGAAMSVTAFPVLARILSDRKMNRTRIGGLAIASAAVDDVAAWSLLAVVVTIVGSNGNDHSWRILLAPVYLAVMFLGVRPLMRIVNQRFLQASRLTPDMLGIVVVLLVASSFTTEWLGVHYIFGAFIMGACMPRETGEALRHAILERFEQLSVLVLLPVFFVVSGVKVDLSQIDSEGFGELGLILVIAIGGKFLGAYLGAKSSGVGGRQAGALATLMNTRGLTELVILNVGLMLGALDTKLFTLMVLMALITTAMTGPILSIIYPKRLVERDIADGERALLGAAASYRVLAVVGDQVEPAVVDAAIDVAAARGNAAVVITRLLQQGREDRLEVGTGMAAELLAMTANMSELHALAARGKARGVDVNVVSQFSEDVPADLTRLIRTSDPDFVVLTESIALAPDPMLPRTVIARAGAPASPAAVAVTARAGADGAIALQVAAHLAASRGLELVIAGSGGRREKSAVAELAKSGLTVRTGDIPDAAILVGTEADPGVHLAARGRPDDNADEITDWAEKLSVQGGAAATPPPQPSAEPTPTAAATTEETS